VAVEAVTAKVEPVESVGSAAADHFVQARSVVLGEIAPPETA